MKSILKAILATLFIITFLNSCKDDEESTATKTLTLNLTGLEELGPDYVYEGWLIVDGGGVITTGIFSSVVFPQTFEINEDKLNNSSRFVLTIEPANDPDPGASNIHILSGNFSGSTANVSVDIGDFSNASGKYILATPTDGMDNNENSGIWFLDPSSGAPLAGLNLPTLPSGWIYEGWAVIDDQPVTTGTFRNVSATDNFNGFSGAIPLPSVNGADGFFPGEDFLMAAPSGLTFPTDLAGGTAVISIEPVPDNSPMPFALKPLVGMISTDATDHTLYNMSQNLESFPGGSVSR
ncbi:MAG: anti-sigma factor [Flavobacteriaceae bacterium]|nr:anti-sigma factor [Flavobacteriaceae bacterium]